MSTLAVERPRLIRLEPRAIMFGPAAELWLPDLSRPSRKLLGDLLLKPRILAMAGGLSNFLQKGLFNEAFGATNFTAGGSSYCGLWTATLDASSTGSTAGETTYGSYARVLNTNNTTTWPNATGTTSASKSTGAAYTFAANTSGTPTLTYAVINDAVTAGNNYAWFSITSTTLAVGDIPFFSSGNITGTLT